MFGNTACLLPLDDKPIGLVLAAIQAQQSDPSEIFPAKDR